MQDDEERKETFSVFTEPIYSIGQLGSGSATQNYVLSSGFKSGLNKERRKVQLSPQLREISPRPGDQRRKGWSSAKFIVTGGVICGCVCLGALCSDHARPWFIPPPAPYGSAGVSTDYIIEVAQDIPGMSGLALRIHCGNDTVALKRRSCNS
jgi:hypothetical protein